MSQAQNAHSPEEGMGSKNEKALTSHSGISVSPFETVSSHLCLSRASVSSLILQIAFLCS